MDIKDILKNRRLELGLTMKEVSLKVGVSEGTISRWESGDIENMRRDKISALAEALDISPSVIMGWDESSGFVSCESFSSCHENDHVYRIVQKLLSLDRVDQARIEERIDILLEDEKYQKETSNG